MKLQARMDRIDRRLGNATPHPLTLFLLETRPGLPVGERVVWDGLGREIVFDPADGPPRLPPGGPHKLLIEMDPDWI